MKKDIKIDEIEINGVVYIRKETNSKNTGEGLYREVEYAGYVWNVIAEDNESLTMLMKNCLKINGNTKLMAFNSKEEECIWWKDSTIRRYLNNDFIKKLNKDDLLPMTTETWLYGESKVCVDKVRMLSIEEIYRLPKDVLSKDFWYWLLSPYSVYSSYATMFYVNTNGHLSNAYVNLSSGAVAPVIKLKTKHCNQNINND